MGVITKVELINFMCHDNLTCVAPSLHPRRGLRLHPVRTAADPISYGS